MEDMAESMDDVLGMVPRMTGGGLLFGAAGATGAALSFSAIVFEDGFELELELDIELELAFESGAGVEEVEEEDCTGVVAPAVVVVGLCRSSVGVVSCDIISLER